MQKRITFFLILIFFLAFLLRTWRVDHLPTFISDEASIGYNAYSILKTGRDEWGKFLPLTFKSFGEYKLPLYIFFTVPSITIFGLNEFAVRFPSILFGSLTVMAVYFLTRELLSLSKIKSFHLPLIASFLLSISSWHVQVSRMALEANLSLFIIILATIFFMKGFMAKKFFYLSFFLYAASFYTYNVCRVFAPFLILGLVVIFYYRLAKLKKTLIFSSLMALVLISPIFFNGFIGTTQRIAQVSIFSDPGIISHLNEQRSACQKTLPLAFCRLVYNRPITFSQVFLRNYFSHFSLNFLFLKGAGLAQYGMPNWGVLYIFEFPLIILGIIYFRKSKEIFLLLLLWIFISPLANSFTGPAHPVRAIFLLPIPQVLAAGGVVFLLEKFTQVRWLKISLLILLVTVAGFSLNKFLDKYFFSYQQNHFSTWQAGYKDLYPKLALIEKDYSKICISKFYGEPHIFYLFYRQYEPSNYQRDIGVVRYERDDRWVNVDKIGSYYFLQEINLKSINGCSLLVIAPQEQLPNLKVDDQIKYNDGKVAFIIAKNL